MFAATSGGTPGICAQGSPAALAVSTRTLINLWHVGSWHALPRIVHDATVHLESLHVRAQPAHIICRLAPAIGVLLEAAGPTAV